MFVPGSSQPQQFFDVWSQLAREHLARLESLSEQVGKLQGQGVQRAHQAIDESAKLMKASMDYATELGAEWRKLGLEATRKTAEIMTPKA